MFPQNKKLLLLLLISIILVIIRQLFFKSSTFYHQTFRATKSAEVIYNYEHQEVKNAAETTSRLSKKVVLRSKKEPSRLLDLVNGERSKIKPIGVKSPRERNHKPVSRCRSVSHQCRGRTTAGLMVVHYRRMESNRRKKEDVYFFFTDPKCECVVCGYRCACIYLEMGSHDVDSEKVNRKQDNFVGLVLMIAMRDALARRYYNFASRDRPSTRNLLELVLSVFEGFQSQIYESERYGSA